MNYQTALDTWWFGLLTGNSDLVAKATGGIWNKRPNAQSQPPYVIGSTVSDVPTYTNGSVFKMATVTIRLQAVTPDVTPTGKPYADTMEDDIDSVMGGGSQFQATQNGYYFSVTRGKSIDMGPWNQNRPYRYRGYEYLVRIRPVPS